MPALFLSYRRIDSEAWCARLSYHLSLRFGDDMVFRDVDDLKAGMRWQQQIDAALRGTRVVLVLIGPKWFSAGQRRRLEDRRDVLRREIATALHSPRRKVVPVLLGGALLPKAALLPPALRPLCDWQAVALRDRQWRPDVERLVERLRELVPQPGRNTLARIHDAMQRDQDSYFELLKKDSPKRALTIALSTLRKLNQVCPAYPQDTDLQLVRGYTHKNIAMAERWLEREDAAQRSLAEAWRTFATATQERPKDAGAWNGMGSVALVRGQPKLALRYIDKALALVPGYPAALHDRELALAALGRR